jgi:hypothetical protein
VNPVDDLDCIVNVLASSPVTITAYELSRNALPNVMADVLGVPVNDAADPDPAFALAPPALRANDAVVA